MTLVLMAFCKVDYLPIESLFCFKSHFTSFTHSMVLRLFVRMVGFVSVPMGMTWLFILKINRK